MKNPMSNAQAKTHQIPTEVEDENTDTNNIMLTEEVITHTHTPTTEASSESFDFGAMEDKAKNYYNKLYQDGKLVKINCGRWSMEHKLSSDDLNIEKGTLPDIINLGKKLLIKPAIRNKFVNMESAARRFLDRNSMAFAAADAHFVPNKKIFDVVVALSNFQTQFYALVEDFMENYDQYRNDMIEAYPDHRNILEGYYPTAEFVRPKFHFSYKMVEMVMPQEFNDVDIQEIISREGKAEEAKEVFLAHMEREAATHKEQLEEFINEAAVTIRANIIETCQHVVGKINKGELISKANINSIKAQINDFRDFNFLGDSIVDSQLNSLDKMVAGDTDYKDNKEAVEKLNAILGTVIDTASNLSDVANVTGEYFRSFDA